uniref:Uncharacterized protein n=1 Tax=Arundo donax TaxID=35708 RepID=A0A0A9AS49_ARUDO
MLRHGAVPSYACSRLARAPSSLAAAVGLGVSAVADQVNMGYKDFAVDGNISALPRLSPCPRP